MARNLNEWIPRRNNLATRTGHQSAKRQPQPTPSSPPSNPLPTLSETSNVRLDDMDEQQSFQII